MYMEESEFVHAEVEAEINSKNKARAKLKGKPPTKHGPGGIDLRDVKSGDVEKTLRRTLGAAGVAVIKEGQK